MSSKSKVQFTAEQVGKALGEGASSLTRIWHSLGGKGSVPGSVASRMRELVPGLSSVIAANKAAEASKTDGKGVSDGQKADHKAAARKPTVKATKPAAKPSVTPPAKAPKGIAKGKPAGKGKPKALPPHHPQNPYVRSGSSYGVVFDLLAQPQFLAKGINRVDLVKLAAAATGKDLKRAGYDIIVVCSPVDSSPTCHRHRSAREGYGVQKVNGWVKLVLPKA